MLPLLVQPAILPGTVANSPAMVEAARRVHQFAAAHTPVVFLGETGTGKSFLAASLHAQSGRPGAFVESAGGELRPELARGDLFGHERGAFTGAVARRAGLLEQAHSGTFLLDDFHLLDADVQGALLRFIETRRYRPLGAQRDLPLTCALVFGIGRDLDVLVAEGRLLADLRYRLGFCLIRLPRLEDRREDIVPFARAFLARAPETTGAQDGPAQFAADVFPLLESASYPGNVRELKGRIEAAYLLARGEDEVRAVHLSAGDARVPVFPRRGSPTEQRNAVQWALTQTGGRVGAAARLLNISRNTASAVKRRVPGDHQYRVEDA